MPDPTPAGVIAGRTAWLKRLEQDYGDVAERLMAAYASTQRRLAPYQSRFTDELVRMADAGIPITPDHVRGLPQWSQLLAQIEIEMNAFSRLVEAETSVLADRAVVAGPAMARQLTLFTLPDEVKPQLAAVFIEPSPEALRRLIDYVDGPAMRDSLNAFGDKATAEFADHVLSGFAQGKHPVTMARGMAQWLDLPFMWAENTLRTSYLWSYRAANHLTYAANDHLLDGWMWWSARDTRTCYSCWSQHGKIFPTSAFLNDHHRGRCTPMPVVTGTTWADDLLVGPDLFATLPDSDQVAILGPSLFDLFKQGKLPWDELSRPYRDNVYGEMLAEAAVRDILRRAA